MRYPFDPGHKADGPSADAAAAMAPSVETLRRRCLAAILREPMTADECATFIGTTVLAARPRLSELHKLGLIEDAGERRRNESGKLATVWKAAPDARTV